MLLFWFFPQVNTAILARKIKCYKNEKLSKILVTHFIQSHISQSVDVTLEIAIMNIISKKIYFKKLKLFLKIHLTTHVFDKTLHI